MNRLLSSMVAFGVGAYAYKVAEDRGMLTRRNMNRMRKRVMRAFS
ncbi:YrzQ family protein [Bacillus songklensis]|uniref:YrzQ family protein n=1 Tax=Bacillus songklensis TaxID=1069116 RepID=A0ABV8B1B5_9BACI